MQIASPQLSLKLSLTPAFSWSRFYVGANAELVSVLHHVVDTPQFVYLWGHFNVGKTHLLQATCQELLDHNHRAFYLSLKALKGCGPSVLEGLDRYDCLCLDDIHEVAGDAAWETALFSLYNDIQAHGKSLVVVSQHTPDAAGFKLPDLVSRLQSGMTYYVNPIAEDKYIDAIQYQAALYGFKLNTDVQHFLMTRTKRDIAHLAAIFKQLDQLSLVEQRRLTVPFLKKVLVF